jgi:uncharacterized cupredoxin-like copper-binding protein
MKSQRLKRWIPLSALSTAIGAILLSGPAAAHGDAHSRKPASSSTSVMVEKSFGKTGHAAQVTRTVNVDMSDHMRFSPDALTVREGETLRFVVKNSGKLMHEFVLGTLPELKEHAELMQKFPSMEHDEPYMAHVAPGKTQTIVWQFTRTGVFHFGCLLPGHFEAGMVGKINVTSRKSS